MGMSTASSWPQNAAIHTGRMHHVAVVLQVSVDGNVHVADITVHVEDVLIKVDTSDGPDGNTQLDLSFALDSEALPDARARSNDTLSAVPEDPPCFSVVGAQLNWFGSMCLSACQGSEDPAFKCAVPLPSTGVPSPFPHTVKAAVCHQKYRTPTWLPLYFVTSFACRPSPVKWSCTPVFILGFLPFVILTIMWPFCYSFVAFFTTCSRFSVRKTMPPKEICSLRSHSVQAAKPRAHQH